MSAGDPDDVIRSLRRYVSQMLGSPPWTVRLQRTRVADDERPVAIIDPGLLTTPRARATIPQGDVQKMQSFTIVCYPAIGDSAASSAETARAAGNLLDAGFSRGLVTDDVPPVDIGGPYRIPIFDYAAIPIEGPTRALPAGAEPYSYANLDLTLNMRPIQDALDEQRYTVVANLRLTWWAGGRVPAVAPPVATGGLVGSWGGNTPPP